MHFILVPLVYLAPLTVPQAQVSLPTTAPSSLSIDDAVREAIAHNPRVLAAARDIGAAASGVRSARALVNPSVVIAPGITSVSGTGEEFLAQQPLEVNGTRSARAGIADADLAATKAQSLATLRGVVFAVRSAYYELARTREQASVARDALSTAQEFDSRLAEEATRQAALVLVRSHLAGAVERVTPAKPMPEAPVIVSGTLSMPLSLPSHIRGWEAGHRKGRFATVSLTFTDARTGAVLERCQGTCDWGDAWWFTTRHHSLRMTPLDRVLEHFARKTTERALRDMEDRMRPLIASPVKSSAPIELRE